MKTKTSITLFFGLLVVLVIAMVMLITAGAQAGEKVKSQGDDQMPPGLKKIPPGLEKIVFIHYKKGRAKPDKPVKPDRPGKPSGDTQCYGFMGRGVKWKGSPGDCYVHPDLGLDLVILSGDTWDIETSMVLFSDYVPDFDANWDDHAPDGRNEMSFGDYPQAGVIAVTVVWGYFSGPPGIREIFEFDILFDTDYNWGYVGETDEVEDYDTDVMDLQNIATHEIGHGLGLADFYTDGCSEVTMFGYSAEGETKKRTLDPADITGLQELYGE